MSDPFAPLKVASVDPSLAPYQQASGFSTPIDLDGLASPFSREWNPNDHPPMPMIDQEPSVRPASQQQQQPWIGNFDLPFAAGQYQASNNYVNQQGLSINTNVNDQFGSSCNEYETTDNFDYDGNFGTPSHSSHPSLSHHPSTTSLSSLVSWNDVYGQPSAGANGPNFSNGLDHHQSFSQIRPQPQSITRQSSMSSFTSHDHGLSTPFEGMGSVSYPQTYDYTQTMPVHVNAFTTPGKTGIGRQRSSSRARPYTRHGRSSSNASFASFDPLGDHQTPIPNQWNQGARDGPAGLESGMKKVSLHHRRTSSRTSTMMASPINTVPSATITRLSRAGRSSSMSALKSSGFDFSDAPPLPTLQGGTLHGGDALYDGEEAIKAALQARAQQCLSISSTAQQDKARTMWVKYWLKVAYTTAPGYTVPRQGLYHSYELSCSEYGVKPINSASFGKAVRAAYPGIRTRRLGVRGNSKYHYQAMRPAMAIEAQRLNEYGNSTGQWYCTPNTGIIDFQVDPAQAQGSMEIHEEDEDDEDSELDDDNDSIHPYRTPSLECFNTVKPTRRHSRHGSGSMELGGTPQRPGTFHRRHTTSLARLESPSNSTSNTFRPQKRLQPTGPKVFDLPQFPKLGDILAICQGLDHEDVSSFWDRFCQHQDDLVSCIELGEYDAFESHCRDFWGALQASTVHTCQKLLSEHISTAMAVTYSHIIETLSSTATRQISHASWSSLRSLGESLKETMEVSLHAFDAGFKQYKVELAVRAAHLMLRSAELITMSSTLSPILANGHKVRQMLGAWATLDTRSISDQCALALACEQSFVERIFTDMEGFLERVDQMAIGNNGDGYKAITKLAGWIDNILDHVRNGGDHAESTMAMIPSKTSFITAQVMRQLTLDSHPAFGLFQLLKTWIEDYVSIAVVRKTSLVPDPATFTLPSIPGLSVEIPPFDAVRGIDLATAVPPPLKATDFTASQFDLMAIDPGLLDSSSTQLAMPYQDYRMGTPKPNEQPIFSFPKNDS